MPFSSHVMLIINECISARLAQPNLQLQTRCFICVAHIARAVVLRTMVQTEVVQKFMYCHFVEQRSLFHPEGGHHSALSWTEPQPQNAEVFYAMRVDGDVGAKHTHNVIGTVECELIADDGIGTIPLARLVKTC